MLRWLVMAPRRRTSLREIQMIKKHIFTVYHSQTDDQYEVLNHIMKDYLHVYNVKDQII